MPQRMYYINDPVFAEYTYHCMKSASADVIQNLEPGELIWFRNDSLMKRFADKESLEKRMLLLARIGISFTVIFAPKKTAVDEIIDGLYLWDYEYVDNRKKLAKAIYDKKLFAFGSREILMVSHMAAQNTHNQVFVLNYQYLKMQSMLKEVARPDPLTTKINEAIEGFDMLADICRHAFNTSDNVQAISGVSEMQMRILLALLPARNRYVDKLKILEMTNSTYRDVKPPRMLVQLEEEDYIHKQRLKDGNEPGKVYYTILEKGIDAAMRYLKYVHKQLDL